MVIHQILRRGNAPLPIILLYDSTSSAPDLMPDYHPRAAARLVSCYALFK